MRKTAEDLRALADGLDNHNSTAETLAAQFLDWRTDFGEIPFGRRVLFWVPPYGPTTGHVDYDGRHLHSVLNKEAEPTFWAHIPSPEAKPEREALADFRDPQGQIVGM